MIQVKVTMGIENSQFSAREKEVIDLLLQGRSNKQIAFELHIAQSTVEYHLKNIYHKLEVASRTEAVLRLGKSTGHDTSSELGEIQAEKDSRVISSDGKPTSIQRIPVNKMYWIIAGLLIVLVATITLTYMFNKDTNGTATSVPTLAATNMPTTLSTPQASTVTPVLGTPTATGTPQPPGTQSQDQVDVDTDLQAYMGFLFVEDRDPKCLTIECIDVLKYLEVGPKGVEHPEMLRVLLPENFGQVRVFADQVGHDRPWQDKLYLLTVFGMTINRDPVIPNRYENGTPTAEPNAPFAPNIPQVWPVYEVYLGWIEELDRIRRDNRALREGRLIPLETSATIETPATIIAYARKHESQTVIVVLNKSDAEQQIKINLAARRISCSKVKNLLDLDDPIQFEERTDDMPLIVTLTKWEAKIIKCG